MISKLINWHSFNRIYCAANTDGSWVLCAHSNEDMTEFSTFKQTEELSYEYKLDFMELYQCIEDRPEMYIDYDVDIYENQLLGATIYYLPKDRSILMTEIKRNILKD